MSRETIAKVVYANSVGLVHSSSSGETDDTAVAVATTRTIRDKVPLAASEPGGRTQLDPRNL